ncbi:hypothetical protein [Capsulimonas corticalis]|nr:hypothetical protein [Capsulimonas corticalis]
MNDLPLARPHTTGFMKDKFPEIVPVQNHILPAPCMVFSHKTNATGIAEI